jgi:uncharacterized phiE125 gp8 family phage protein
MSGSGRGGGRFVSAAPWPNLSLQQPLTYKVTIPRGTTPVTLDQVKEQLKNPDDSDTYLTLLINAATQFFERFTNRILINTQFETLLDFFTQSIELRRAPLVSLEAFEYLVDGVATPVPPSDFYTTFETDYSRVVFLTLEDMPQDKDDVLQSVTVRFTSGFGTASTDIPPDIQLALLQHITSLNENRGDCSTAGTCISESVPASAMAVYKRYRIGSITQNIYRGGGGLT